MINEPRQVASGEGWAVHRLGRSFCVMVEGADEVWISREDDLTRNMVASALIAGAYGPVDRDAAIAACQANWSAR